MSRRAREVFGVTSADLVFFFTLLSTHPARNRKEKKKETSKIRSPKEVPLPCWNTSFYVCHQVADGRQCILPQPRSHDED
jgi:hypothetical protein